MTPIIGFGLPVELKVIYTSYLRYIDDYAYHRHTVWTPACIAVLLARNLLSRALDRVNPFGSNLSAKGELIYETTRFHK